MEYALSIRPANIEAHLDIEREIANRKNGQMTMTIKVNAGNIVDLTMVEYVDVRQYVRLKSITLTELGHSPDLGSGNLPNALRNTHSQL